ncbi:MAG: alpha/beta fold hydrolase [Bacteroidia bacterium]
MNNTMQAQSWVDTVQYPFAHHYFQLEAGRMHYVDEGEGEVILFVHGTPTWSFLYRDMIRELSKSHRCIAIDHLGFGLSDKPQDFPGTPQAHARNLSAFIQALDLKDITLVVHDFGGPIGLSAAIAEPVRIKKIVLFNTWLWETASDPGARKVDKIVNSALGRFLYLRMNFSPKVLLKKGFADKANLTKNIHRQYLLPFPDKTSRYPLLRLAKSLVGASSWYQEQWELLHKISDKPWLLVWGTKDKFITTGYLEKWRTRLPEARIVEMDCGHFVQEEMSGEAIIAMKDFLSDE